MDYKNCKYNGEKKYIENEAHGLKDLTEIVGILREHCPWDMEQTFESLKETVKNESDEVLEAIDKDDADNLCEELGDMLLQIVFLSRIASEKKLFSMEDVIQTVSDKMIRRHPHVFGDVEVSSREEIGKIWKEVKANEKAKKLKQEKRSLQ